MENRDLKMYMRGLAVREQTLIATITALRDVFWRSSEYIVETRTKNKDLIKGIM